MIRKGQVEEIRCALSEVEFLNRIVCEALRIYDGSGISLT
jgi:hypothetical protein